MRRCLEEKLSFKRVIKKLKYFNNFTQSLLLTATYFIYFFIKINRK
ncbi:MAG: hypothetical protein RXN79_03215 [Candidatus Nanopusillus sp.]